MAAWSGVSGDPFEAVNQKLLHGMDVGIDQFGISFDAPQFFAVRDHALEIGSGSIGCLWGAENIAAAGFGNLRDQLFTQPDALPDHFRESVRIKIDIGQGGEKGFDGKAIDFGEVDAVKGSFDRHHGKAFKGKNQKILQGCRFGLFAAYTNLGTSFSLGCLLTLVTKHYLLLLIFEFFSGT